MTNEERIELLLQITQNHPNLTNLSEIVKLMELVEFDKQLQEILKA